ncbi:MAG: hypothetical protein ACRCZF_14670 [Gemmataceae bacterium]
MPLTTILTLLMGGVLALTPLTLYLFWLSAMNRGERPSIARAGSDFLALLAGLGGFLGLGLFLVLTALTTLSRGTPLVARELRRTWGEERLFWLIAATVVLGFLAGVLMMAYLRRRGTLVIYNIDETTLDARITLLLNEMGFVAERRGNLWSDGRALVEVDPFWLFRHVTVTYLGSDARLGEEFERKLRSSLNDAPPAERHPAGPWITSAAIGVFFADLSCVLLLIVASFAAK